MRQINNHLINPQTNDVYSLINTSFQKKVLYEIDILHIRKAKRNDPEFVSFMIARSGYSGACLGPCQTSMMEFFAELVNPF